jgi:hypothetical protein
VFEIGNSLREARVRQQLELSEVELATKIRARYLRALEEENFETLPAQTYVKGFLRTYADYLGLDGQVYVDEFNSRYGDEEQREPVVARRTSPVGRQHRRLERRWVAFALAGIAAVVVFVIAAWRFGGNSNEPIPNLATTTTTATTTSKKPKPARPAVTKPAKPAKPVIFHIYMRATHGNCWMDVRNRSSSGRSRFTGTVELGQAKLFYARRLSINFGAPSNLSIVYNGKLVSIPRGGIYLFTARGYTRTA